MNHLLRHFLPIPSQLQTAHIPEMPVTNILARNIVAQAWTMGKVAFTATTPKCFGKNLSMRRIISRACPQCTGRGWLPVGLPVEGRIGTSVARKIWGAGVAFCGPLGFTLTAAVKTHALLHDKENMLTSCTMLLGILLRTHIQFCCWRVATTTI